MKLPLETIEKRYWSTGELAIKFSTSVSKIRFYCTYFHIEPARTRNNNRKFNQADVDKLSAVISYVQQGYKLWAIKNKI